MDLLYSRTIPGPEFVSLSILLHFAPEHRPDILSCRRRLSGSLSTVSQSSCLEALTELHFYINSVLKATTKHTTTAARFLKEDEKFLSFEKNGNDFVTQIFRPKKCHGIAMQYHLVRDRKQLSSFLVPLILSSSKGYSASAIAGFETKEVAGVVFCVGMGGGPSAAFGVGTSPLTHSLSQRMKKCLGILCGKTHATVSNAVRRNRSGTSGSTATTSSTRLDPASARSLLTTMLLTDDEDRLVNSVASGEQRTEINQEDQFTRRMLLTTGSKKRGTQGVGSGDENPLQASSADQARIIVERMAVLSVFDFDSILRKYQNRQAAREALSTSKSSKKRLRRFARDADLDGFDFRGERRSSFAPNPDRNAGKSIGGKGAGIDDVSVSARSTFTTGSNLTLKGPKKDTASRTSNYRSRQHTSPGALPSSSKDSTSISRVGGRRNAHSRRPSAGMDAIEGNSSFVSPLRSPPGTISSRYQQPQGRQLFDPFSGDPTDNGSSVGSAVAKVLVNIALNEDLTCFYKVSKLSSSSVEGVVQVQVKTNVDLGVPFSLLIRDPSNFIQSLQENKKYAESTADYPTNSDFTYTVSVPKADEYFPVMRYKCGDELRPVPIRVQTRVRLEETHWRVALQISSNPHNEDSLTDLTIIMGVPSEVRGETLTTSPPGGVWNAAKRSVIWCVSELGGGEKFQLQARFNIDANELNNFNDDEKPKFPVLVRCQCMYAQLSDIELEVRALPHAMDADVKMKLARRFRLSHRERP
eukprot:jgi/Psemu1/183737/e_gw1.34.74.1